MTALGRGFLARLKYKQCLKNLSLFKDSLKYVTKFIK